MFHRFDHIWDDAVARNTAALKTVVASLLGLLSVYGGTEAVKVPRGIYSTIVQVLRPAEAALRRLIVIVARDVKLDVKVSKVKSAGQFPKARLGKSRSLSFPLFDPRKRFGQTRRENRKSMIPPLRPGKPPGHRNTPSRGIDYILEECHKFAMGVLSEARRPSDAVPNTS